MAEIAQLLTEHRLLTLTGAGGCGKTRLALQVAADLGEEYPDGLWLVELAPLAEPALVTPTVAATLGVREEPGRPLTATLADYLRAKSLLLLLDNCEHLLSACAGLADHLLCACPGLRILATSRETLGVPGEQSYLVPSLSVPEPGLSSVEQLREYEAVQLFTDRALLCRPTFSVTSANAASVVEVCQRLDGIPLAIELAAARLKLLPVEQIAARLDHRFRLLTGGSRTALPRQQTLRAAIDWSYDLLSEEERMLLQRLSVFAGGWTLKAAEAVCSDDERPTTVESFGVGRSLFVVRRDEVMDLLGQLVDKSLVQVEEAGGEVRYRLLETIRQYGAEKRQGAGQDAPPGATGSSPREQALRGRHRDWFLALAEQAEPELRGRGRRGWLSRLEDEHDNLQSALDWCVEQRDGGAGLRLGAALWQFWLVRGHLSLDCFRELLTSLLTLPGAEARTVARGKALRGAAALTFRPSECEAARSLHEESLAISREREDPLGIADSLRGLGVVKLYQGDGEAARALYMEGLAISRERGDPQGIATALESLGALAIDLGDDPAARMLYEESLANFREQGDQLRIAHCLEILGMIAIRQREYPAARKLCEESLAIRRESGNPYEIFHALGALGHVARETGEYACCADLYRESLALRHACHDGWRIAQSLEDFAGLAGRQRQWERAVRLLGASESVAQSHGRSVPVSIREEYERTVEGARAVLGEAAFAAAWAEGRALSLDEAVAFALEEQDPS